MNCPRFLPPVRKLEPNSPVMSLFDCRGRSRPFSNTGWKNIFQTEKRRCLAGLELCVAVKSLMILNGLPGCGARGFSPHRLQICLRSAVVALESAHARNCQAPPFAGCTDRWTYCNSGLQQREHAIQRTVKQ